MWYRHNFFKKTLSCTRKLFLLETGVCTILFSSCNILLGLLIFVLDVVMCMQFFCLAQVCLQDIVF